MRDCWQAILSRMYGTDDMDKEGTPTCFHDGKTYRQLKKISLFDLIRAGCSDDDTRALTNMIATIPYMKKSPSNGPSPGFVNFL